MIHEIAKGKHVDLSKVFLVDVVEGKTLPMKNYQSGEDIDVVVSRAFSVRICLDLTSAWMEYVIPCETKDEAVDLCRDITAMIPRRSQ